MKRFWKLCLQEKFVTLRKFSLEILSLFKSTYICAIDVLYCEFDKIEIKKLHRHLVIRIVHRVNTTTGCWIDIENLAFEKQNVNHHVNYENGVDIK